MNARIIVTNIVVYKRISSTQANTVKLTLGRETLALHNQDLVCSIGMIDYAAGHAVTKLIDRIYHCPHPPDLPLPAPGGMTVTGNFDTENPDLAFMDDLLDLKLTHQSPHELMELSAQSRFRTRARRDPARGHITHRSKTPCGQTVLRVRHTMPPAYSLHITTRGYLCLVQLHEMVDNTATSKFDARLN